jgi:hypothetical protein
MMITTKRNSRGLIVVRVEGTYDEDAARKAAAREIEGSFDRPPVVKTYTRDGIAYTSFTEQAL